MDSQISIGTEMLQVLAGQIRLEFDVNRCKTEYHEEFESRYRQLTGKRLSASDDGYNQVDKWGRQYRIYVSLNAEQRAALQSLGLRPTRNDQYQAQGYNYRITSEDLFGDLVRLGWRLGDNPE